MNILTELLIKHGCSADAEFIEDSINDFHYSYMHIRDELIKIGTIVEEIQDKHIYVATIKVGLCHSIIAVQLQGKKLYIIGYAKEGIVKQNICNKTISKFKSSFDYEDKPIKNQVKTSYKYVGIWLVSVAFLMIFLWIAISSVIAYNSITKYNIAVNEFNSVVDEYNELSSTTSIDNIDGFPISLTNLKTEKESILEGIAVVFGKNSSTKIKEDTKTIHKLILELKNSVKIIKQITNPKQEWVEDRLKTVKKITGMQAVTTSNNPDGLLNKEGGYSACVYFTVNEIDPADISGESIVDKGVDAGGAIEVYTTLEDAEARCEYLSGFDGTVLYSGSYAIVGTTVIRTSFLLTDEQQFTITDEITKSFTTITNK